MESARCPHVRSVAQPGKPARRSAATQVHASKAFHLGFGKHASKSTLSDANNKRDYRIFEEFAYRVVAEARACRADDIFKLGGNVYAFDSTTIELCLETFQWALFRKNQRKGGIKVHTLYDIETSIPTFFHITEARVHDMNAMDEIPYEENSLQNLTTILSMNLMVLPNQLYLIVKLYNNRPELLPDTHVPTFIK